MHPSPAISKCSAAGSVSNTRTLAIEQGKKVLLAALWNPCWTTECFPMQYAPRSPDTHDPIFPLYFLTRQRVFMSASLDSLICGLLSKYVTSVMLQSTELLPGPFLSNSLWGQSCFQICPKMQNTSLDIIGNILNIFQKKICRWMEGGKDHGLMII